MPAHPTSTAFDRLEPGNTTFLMVDFQERLFAAMPGEVGRRYRDRARILLEGAQILGVPVVVTEQYPQGLGPTVPELREWIDTSKVIAKREFSCCDAPGFAPALEALRGRQVVVAGMETHICVFQTVRDLLRQGIPVQVLGDACLSRYKLDWRLGIERCRDVGATVTTVEAVLFDLVGVAVGDGFKAISRTVK
ncbi:isochorismatase family protein [Myxococcota bacterium]|nr:isochorismatase family protein [Myxococcota bacterium]